MGKLKENQSGFSVLEVLVGILLVAVMAMGIVKSSTMAMKTREKTVRDSGAMQIALDTVEEFQAIDPSTLSDGNDFTDTVTHNSINYTRVVDIIENSDDTTTVEVNVTSNSSKLGGSANLSVALLDWGAR